MGGLEETKGEREPLPRVARDVMERDVLTISVHCRFQEVQRLLILSNSHGAPVLDDHSRVVGMIAAMDLLRAVDQACDEDLDPGEEVTRDVANLTAEQLATPDPLCVQLETPVAEIAQRMREEGTHRALVVASGKLVGIVSSWDLLLAVR